ncbi:HlyC/CorC family transporter [Rhodovastum atsumiense]|uniref:HlyC/CorC family transporter n=1 Tax=Rhodovastum atsumiense TaxID=504468 RepID=A0A5M6IQS2_9PROT|nr:hemolysin family protein [Rhodovastum atsumiense]KAA5610622.1 HlyC/CorC family transporter [Rhodovastum atsumiense]CAH2600742.1 HlyC/CorC family transporter [Rhodovastum atsumiense]
MLMLELLLILVLVVLNGVFALAELAVVSARRPRLRALAEAARPGAKAALALAEDPGRFLSTVQIGITLVGVLAGAFSGSTFGARLAVWFAATGLPPAVAEPLGFALVVVAVTYLSIVVGELVPKRLALRNAEGLACAMAPAMAILSRVAAPVAWLLDNSTDLVFRLIGLAEEPDQRVTEEDVRVLVAEAQRHGAIEPAERRMITGVLRLGDRPVRGVMTPRGEVDWLDARADLASLKEITLATRHTLLPVGEGAPDVIVGVVRTRDVLAALLRDGQLDIRALVRTAPVVPDGADALDVLAVLRDAEVPMALVHDEYGNFEGVVTPTDLTETIVGAFRADAEGMGEPPAVQRNDGSWLLSGSMPADEAADLVGLQLPEPRAYQTVAGLVLQAMGRVPQAGDVVETLGWHFEVMDMDGHRIDKVLAAKISAAVRPVGLRRPGAGAD